MSVFTLDGSDFTGDLLDRVMCLLPTGLVSLEEQDWGYRLKFAFSADSLCPFFYNASGTLGFSAADRHG